MAYLTYFRRAVSCIRTKTTTRCLISWLRMCLVITLMSCSSEQNNTNHEPSWIHQPARTVDAGYIVYVTSGEDRTLVEATFKAKAAAIEDVANECSFAPKGTRVEDQYDQSVGILHNVFIKMALSFEDCQAAQKALDPKTIQSLANLSLSQELKRYQDAVDLEARQEIADNPPASDAYPVAMASFSPSGSSATPNYAPYFAMRQQVAYAKEAVIIAPPGAYPPNAPQTVQFSNSIQPVVRQVNAYQVSHPEVNTWNHSWSSLPDKPAVHSFSGVQGMRSSVAHTSTAGQFRSSAMHNPSVRSDQSDRSEHSKRSSDRGGFQRHGRHGW